MPFPDNYNSKFWILKSSILLFISLIFHIKTVVLAIHIYNRFHYSQCLYYLSVIVLSYSFYNLCPIQLSYKSRSFSRCFFTHLLNFFEFYVVSFSICLQISIISPGSCFFSDFSFHPNFLPVLLPFILKAYSMGPSLCHTTDILNC